MHESKLMDGFSFNTIFSKVDDEMMFLKHCNKKYWFFDVDIDRGFIHSSGNPLLKKGHRIFGIWVALVKK